jgi:superfamily I DNA and RNA helicase
MTQDNRQGLSRFITTEAIDSQDQNNYHRIWDAVKSAFSPRNNSVGYWRYPLFLEINNERREPDILIVDQEWGLIVINIVNVTINDLVSVENQNITFTENFSKFNNFLENTDQYIQVLTNYTQENESLKNKITGRNLIIFPQMNSQEWQQKGWLGIEEGSSFIFNNQLGEVTLKNRLEKAQPIIKGNSLDDFQYQILLSVISGTYILKKQLSHFPKHEGKTRSNILLEAQNFMYEWDVKQEWIGKSIPPGPQRIRGIAGSGKTILLAQKAVIMHLKHPDWRIAFVFFTRSLYDQIETLIKLWFNHFTNGEVYYNSDESNLKVLHAWGAKNRNGFYRLIAQENNRKPLGVKDISSKSPHRGLAEVCTQLQKTTKIKPIFEAIIIDEGQDFITTNDLKLTSKDGEQKQSFYWLAYQSLKPVSEANPNQKRLIWAYDEGQTIHSATSVVPDAKEIFGSQFNNMLGGEGGSIYQGDIRKAYDMERCYRTPEKILTTAYALATGLLRSGGIIRPERMRKKDLQAIGFQVEGDFRRKNEPITITRPPENSPNPVSQLWDDPLIEFNSYLSRNEELLALVDKVKHNLFEDKLESSRHILIIIFGDKDLEIMVANFLLDYGLDIYISGWEKLNNTDLKYRNTKPDQFWCDRSITLTSVNRAKGNEADVVYLIGLDNIAKNEDNPTCRNQLFVALTRARGWVSMSGIGNYPFYQEIKNVLEQDNSFTFTITGVTPAEDANDDLIDDNKL